MRVLFLAIFAFLAGMAADGALRAKSHEAEVEQLKTDNRTMALQVGSSCDPVYGAYWPTFDCSWAIAVPPYKCAAKVDRYRDGDLDRVLARVKATGARPGMTVLEERGVKERELVVTWKPEVGR